MRDSNVTHSLARCKRLNYSSQTTPSITKQFDSADQSLFRTVVYGNHVGVMHRSLPSSKRLQYELRFRNHNLTLTCKSSYMTVVICYCSSAFQGGLLTLHKFYLLF